MGVIIRLIIRLDINPIIKLGILVGLVGFNLKTYQEKPDPT